MNSKIFSILLVPLVLLSCTVQGQKSLGRKQAQEVKAAVDDLLDTWYPRILDDDHGGYLTNFDHTWTLEEDQPKMIVSQARGLWTAARGFRHSGDVTLLVAAQHGFDFLTQEMWDPIHGGFLQYWHDRDPNSQGLKMTYGNAFAIYALAEYAKVAPDPDLVLHWCKKSLDWLDQAAHDEKLGGYFNLLPRNGQSAKHPDFDAGAIPASTWGDPSWKDQNSSIHLMEAFTTLYEVMPNEITHARLEEMLTLVRDVMVGERNHLHLFFEQNWQPIDHSNKSRDDILANIRHDHVSFGHDIETAYLLVDASEKLYGKCDSKTLSVAKELVDHSLAYGFAPDYYGIVDKGYYFPGTETPEVVDKNKVWWSQAEAWHALVLFARLFPEEKTYGKAAEQMWLYIKDQIMDTNHGGWYPAGLDVNPDNALARKAQQWKSCYHDGRALMQVAEYNR